MNKEELKEALKQLAIEEPEFVDALYPKNIGYDRKLSKEVEAALETEEVFLSEKITGAREAHKVHQAVLGLIRIKMQISRMNHIRTQEQYDEGIAIANEVFELLNYKCRI